MQQIRFLDRMTHPHIATLIVATALGPVAMNLFLPALPAIALHFRTDFAIAQLAISLYLVSIAALQLVIGTLSDRYGRRPVLLICIAISLVATLVVIHAPSIEIFLAGRVFQGTAIAGMVIGRAAIRDVVTTDEAASRIGYVAMAMTLAPMVGPIVGGYLSEIYGWQATFWLIFLFGLTTFVLVWADMGETNHTRGGSFTTQLRAYPELLVSRRFWGYTLTSAFSSGAFFAFLGGGAYLAREYYCIPPSHYGYYFAFVAGGYLVGNYFSGRYSRRAGINLMMLLGSTTSAGGMALALALHFAGLSHPMAFYGAMALVGVGNGLTMPNSIAGIVSARPRLAGSASGLGGFLQIGGGAALSFIAGFLLGPGSSPLPLIVLMLISSLLSVAAALYVVHVARQLARAEQTERTKMSGKI